MRSIVNYASIIDFGSYELEDGVAVVVNLYSHEKDSRKSKRCARYGSKDNMDMRVCCLANLWITESGVITL